MHLTAFTVCSAFLRCPPADEIAEGADGQAVGQGADLQVAVGSEQNGGAKHKAALQHEPDGVTLVQC